MDRDAPCALARCPCAQSRCGVPPHSRPSYYELFLAAAIVWAFWDMVDFWEMVDFSGLTARALLPFVCSAASVWALPAAVWTSAYYVLLVDSHGLLG